MNCECLSEVEVESPIQVVAELLFDIDADTMACIAGGIAEAFYQDIPVEIIAGTMSRLDERMRLIVREFRERFVLG